MLENKDTLEGLPFNVVMWRELLLLSQNCSSRFLLFFLFLHPLHTFFKCLLVDWFLLFIVCVLSFFATYFNSEVI